MPVIVNVDDDVAATRCPEDDGENANFAVDTLEDVCAGRLRVAVKSAATELVDSGASVKCKFPGVVSLLAIAALVSGAYVKNRALSLALLELGIAGAYVKNGALEVVLVDVLGAYVKCTEVALAVSSAVVVLLGAYVKNVDVALSLSITAVVLLGAYVEIAEVVLDVGAAVGTISDVPEEAPSAVEDCTSLLDILDKVEVGVASETLKVVEEYDLVVESELDGAVLVVLVVGTSIELSELRVVEVGVASEIVKSVEEYDSVVGSELDSAVLVALVVGASIELCELTAATVYALVEMAEVATSLVDGHVVGSIASVLVVASVFVYAEVAAAEDSTLVTAELALVLDTSKEGKTGVEP